jgi:hypothetical protein
MADESETPAELIRPADDEQGPRISGWPDSGGIAIITWQQANGQLYEQELVDEQQAATLLQSSADDRQLILISAQLRRRGSGPAS